MKKILIIFAFLGVLTGCQSTDVPADSTGAWKVTSYIDSNGRDRTSRYSNFSFDFATNGQLSVVQGTTQLKGSYSQFMDSGKQKFLIAIQTNNEDLADLNEDWRLVEKTETAIRLNNPNSGNGTKALVFQK